MNTRFLVACSLLALSVFATADARAQSQPSDTPAAPPQSVTGLPDACKLMQKADLEALYPGRPVELREPTLSAIYKGPQYTESCMYIVKLPSPTSSMDTSKFASITIILWGSQSKDERDLIRTFASAKESKETLAKTPRFNMRVEPLLNLGDDAFQVISEHSVDVFVRKDDLYFFLSLDVYTPPETIKNAVALAGQAVKRWRAGVGMVEADSPIAGNTSIPIPADTRVSLTAPADRWPDACELLSLEDVVSVFSDMNVSQPRKTMGKITHYSRVDRVEELPKPIGCDYDAKKTETVDGKRQLTFNSIGLRISDVSTTLESSKKYFNIAGKVGDGDTPVTGVGDEATMSIMNQIYIRKGVLNISVRVGGGERDKALHADARRRALELAKLVSAKLR
jgi:hypothetical protein